MQYSRTAAGGGGGGDHTIQQQNSMSLIVSHQHPNHNMPLHGLISSTTNNSFISPMRGATAAVPGHQLQSNTSHVVSSASNLLMGGGGHGGGTFARAHLNSQLQRDLSYSPYQVGVKKRASGVQLAEAKPQQSTLNALQKNSRITISGHLNDLFTRNQEQDHVTLQPSAGAGTTLSHNNNNQQQNHQQNRLLAYNLITMEDAERKYQDIIDNEKQHYRRKEAASREIIQELTRKVKTQEKRINEESKISMELKKRHDLMRKRLEKSVKDKQESVSQLKSLFGLFTQQRKALEVSIQKTKRLEDDHVKLQERNKYLEDQALGHNKKVLQLEQERETVIQKHRRDRESLETELEERRQQSKKQEVEAKEAAQQKQQIKRQLEEYEGKVKKLIIEFEEESKKHIRELNDVHEQYRGYKSASLELESRLAHYRSDMQKSQESERQAKKELHRVRLENDELRERLRFIDQRYASLVQRFGASPEELQEIDEQIRGGADGGGDGRREAEDEEAQVIYQGKNGNPRATSAAHMKNQQSEKQHPFQRLVDVRQAKNLLMDPQQPSSLVIMDDYDHHHPQHDTEEIQEMAQEIAMIDQAVERARSSNKAASRRGVAAADTKNPQQQRRTESRMEKRGARADEPDQMESGRRYKQQLANGKYLMPDHDPSSQSSTANKNEYYNEQYQLLEKLMSNLRENPALQNAYIREVFHLESIQSEQDLQEYKNLLNSMAALFFTNHKMTSISHMFQRWKDSAARKQEERMREKQRSRGGGAGPGGPVKPKGIQIDTELANKDAFRGYKQVNPQHQFMDEPSEIPGVSSSNHPDMMIHIEGEDNILNDDDNGDEDMTHDLQVRGFLDELAKVGPFAKQILNYSYPPLLYQRGDGEEEDDEGEDDEDDEDEDMGDHQNMLAGVDDEDDDAAVRDILAGGGHPEGALALPDFDDDYGGAEDDDDREIQQLINGAGGLNNDELYRKIKKTVNQHSDTLPLESNNLMEHVDEHGNVYLVDEHGNVHFPVEDEDGNHLIIDGDEGDLDDEEFLAMMEQEAMLRGGGQHPAAAVPHGQNNSTIINSSQNTSLEDNFVVDQQ